MEISYTFRHIEPSDSVRQLADEKLHRLGAFLQEPAGIHVILEMDGVQHRAELTVTQKNMTAAASDLTDDMYKSLDGAIHKLERQLRRHKERRTAHR